MQTSQEKGDQTIFQKWTQRLEIFHRGFGRGDDTLIQKKSKNFPPTQNVNFWILILNHKKFIDALQKIIKIALKH